MLDPATDPTATPEAPRVGTPPFPCFAVVPGAIDGLDGSAALDQLVNLLGEAVCVTDGQFRFLGINAAMASIYGATDPRQMLGKTAFDVYPGFRQSVFYEAFHSVIRDHTTQSRLGYSSTARAWISVRAAPIGKDRYALTAHRVTHRSDAGGIVGQYDPLTSLPNRWRLDADMDGPHDDPARVGTLILIDARCFRHVAGTFPQNSDPILVEMAARIQRHLQPPQQQAYHLGADRFAIWSRQDHATLMDRLDRVRRALDEPFAVRGGEINLKFAIGLAAQPPEARALQTMVHAECALNAAKEQDGACIEYHAGLADPRHDADLVALLHVAMRDGTLAVHYQPIASTGGPMLHAEALVRWQHPQRGLLSPALFLPLAEDMGWMTRIDRLVLVRATLDVAQLRHRWPDFTVAVNLSSASLCDLETIDAVRDALAHANLPGGALLLEITESSLIRNPDRSHAVLAGLRDLGVVVAIDDFGSGHASFAYMASYPAGVIKIDQSLIAPIVSSNKHRIMVHNIIRMAHGLGARVVAEGVEDAQQHAILTDMQCDLLQGWHLGRPVPIDRLESILTNQEGPPSSA